MTGWRAWTGVLLGLWLLACPAAAAPQAEPPPPPPPPPPATAPAVATPHRWSLVEAISSALTGNPDMISAAVRPALDDCQVKSSKTLYDVGMRLRSYLGQTPVPAGINPGLLMNHDNATSIGLQARTPGGTTWSVEYWPIQNNGALGLTGPNATTLTIVNNVRAGLAVPLVKDAGRINTAAERRAKLLRDSDMQGLLIRAQDTITATERAYWGLVLGERVIARRETAVEQGKTFLATVQARVDAGKIAPYQVFEAQHDLTQRTLSLTVARRESDAARERLAYLIASPTVDVTVAPPEGPIEVPPLPSLEALLEEARQNRPEIRQAELAMRLADIDAETYRNNVRPRVDLTADYFTDTRIQGSSGYRVGMEFATPLGGGPDVERERVLLLRRQALMQLEAARRLVEQDVRLAMHEVEGARLRATSAKQALAAARELLEAEQLRFETGLVSTHPVLLASQKVNEAGDLEALADYEMRIALADLRRARGTALATWKIDADALVRAARDEATQRRVR